MPVGLVFKFISKSRLSAGSFLFKSKPNLADLIPFCFAKFFAIKPLKFTDAMVPNFFQLCFTLILKIGIINGLNYSGVF